MKRNTAISAIIASALALSSCAVETSESNTDVSKKIFDSWMITNGLTYLKPTDVGIYIMEDVPGTGETVDDSMYVFVKMSKTTMDGTISSHNKEELAIQLGTWKSTSRFTPSVWITPNLGIGLRDMLIGANITDNKGTGGMRVGGRRKAIIVPWLKDPDSGNDVVSNDPVYIYDIEVTEVTDDIIQYQVDSLENFKMHYPGGVLADVDSAYFGLYTKYFPTQEEENDTIAYGKSIGLWYIGHYLDGTVFDTNIKDSARFYRIYSESKNYTTLSFSFYKDSTLAVQNNSTVKGFTYAVTQMKNYGDHCKAFFTSDYGYGSSGSGNIPGYEPLFFDIWIKEE